MSHFFPVIDLEATGRNIIRLRTERNLTVRDLQDYFGFAEPNAIYHWQQGKNLPSVDNLYALSELLEVTVNDILVPKQHIRIHEQRAAARCSNYVYGIPKNAASCPAKMEQSLHLAPACAIMWKGTIAFVQLIWRRQRVAAGWRGTYRIR